MREKQLPQRIDSECAVLGSLLIDPESIVLVADFLRPDDFYRDAHAEIYRAMLAIYEQDEPPDSVMVCDYLEQHQRLAHVGGEGYVNGLVNQVPTSRNVEMYGHSVERTALFRNLIKAAGTIAALAYEEIDTALEQAETLIYAISQRKERVGFTPLASVIDDCADRYKSLKREAGGIIGVPTGFADLDKLTSGLLPGKLYLLAARPGQGKSSLSLCIALHAAMQYDRKVGILSIEMPKEELGDKLVAVLAGVDTQDLTKGWLSPEEWKRVDGAMKQLRSVSIAIDDTPVLSLSAMRSKVKRFQAEHGADLLIVDYLQLMEATKDGKPIDNEVQELSMISRGLKQLSRELNVPILALAQLSREVERRAEKIPQLSDLRGSGSLEQDSDLVCFIYREEVYKPDSSMKGKASLLIEKHRGGPRGEVTVGFEARSTRFYDLEPWQHIEEEGTDD